MYSFLAIPGIHAVQAAILPREKYDFFTYEGSKPVTVEFRGKPVQIKKGQVFGVRPSTNKKQIRMVLGDDISRVFTLNLDQAKQLAKGIR